MTNESQGAPVANVAASLPAAAEKQQPPPYTPDTTRTEPDAISKYIQGMLRGLFVFEPGKVMVKCLQKIYDRDRKVAGGNDGGEYRVEKHDGSLELRWSSEDIDIINGLLVGLLVTIAIFVVWVGFNDDKSGIVAVFTWLLMMVIAVPSIVFRYQYKVAMFDEFCKSDKQIRQAGFMINWAIASGKTGIDDLNKTFAGSLMLIGQVGTIYSGEERIRHYKSPFCVSWDNEYLYLHKAGDEILLQYSSWTKQDRDKIVKLKRYDQDELLTALIRKAKMPNPLLR